MVSDIVEIKKNESARLAYLAMHLNRLEAKRLKLEHEYIYHFEAHDSFDLGVKIENIFQRQRAIVVAMLKIDTDTYGKAWRYLYRWQERCQKYRLIPQGKGHTFAHARYYNVPEQYKDHFAIKELSADYSHTEMPVVIEFNFSSIESRRGFMPIVSYVSQMENSKKEFPFLWSISWLGQTVFNEVQIRHFILPELRKLRRKTTNIFLKGLINYYCVLLRKCQEPAMANFRGL